MNDGSGFLDIIFFAVVAAFVLLRLRGVLGRRTGSENPPPRWNAGPPPVQSGPQPANANNIIDLAARRAGPAVTGLPAIEAADPNFQSAQFLAGARAAFEMIVRAFTAGDSATLRPLLSDAVYRDFEQAITARDGAPGEGELIALKSADVEGATLDGRVARITVRFVSLQTIGAEAAPPIEVIDEWMFERDLASRDPNWRLVATRSPEE